MSISNFSLSIFFLGKNPKNVNLDEWNPLDVIAVVAAHGPGIDIISKLWLSRYLNSSVVHLPVLGALLHLSF